MRELSIILPTCNRAPMLKKCLEFIRHGVECSYEVIVIDGASEDDTPAVLDHYHKVMGDRLVIIPEKRREGFVRAANKGFAAARGKCLTWINDDAKLIPGAYDSALQQLYKSPANVGMLALFHRSASLRNIAYEVEFAGHYYKLLHVRGTLYANFGIARRELFACLDYFDNGFYMNGADPDFSLKIWHSHLRVVPAFDCFIDHEEHVDPRREADSPMARADNQRLFEKWNLPERNPFFNEFDAVRPCTLRGLRRPKAAA